MLWTANPPRSGTYYCYCSWIVYLANWECDETGTTGRNIFLAFPTVREGCFSVWPVPSAQQSKESKVQTSVSVHTRFLVCIRLSKKSHDLLLE